VGVITILHAAFFGLPLAISALTLTLGGDFGIGSDPSGLRRFFTAAAALFCLSQFVCGIGILLHRPWAKFFIQRFTVGVVLIAGLAFVRGALWGSTVEDALVILSAIWPVLLHFLLNLRSLDRYLSPGQRTAEGAERANAEH
jgi:hypothetical protein